jgi:hypothetical protein
MYEKPTLVQVKDEALQAMIIATVTIYYRLRYTVKCGVYTPI